MPISASDQITINNIVEGLICTISSSSSNGTNLVNKEEGTVLTSHIYYNNGEIDLYNQEDNHNYDYYYKWDLVNVTGDNNWPRTGKSIVLNKEDFIQDVLIIGCSIYNADEYGAYLNQLNAQIQAEQEIMEETEEEEEEEEEISEPLLLGYGEIILDATIKKWMNFDDNTGLWIYGSGTIDSEWSTLTDNTGFHLYHNINSSLSENSAMKFASFADIATVRQLKMNTLTATPSMKGGWSWYQLMDNVTIDTSYDSGWLSEDSIEENIPVISNLEKFDVELIKTTQEDANTSGEEGNQNIEQNEGITDNKNIVTDANEVKFKLILENHNITFDKILVTIIDSISSSHMIIEKNNQEGNNQEGNNQEGNNQEGNNQENNNDYIVTLNLSSYFPGNIKLEFILQENEVNQGRGTITIILQNQSITIVEEPVDDGNDADDGNDDDDDSNEGGE